MGPKEQIDVCVRGAGIVGTSLALALARQGLRVLLQAPPSPPMASDVRAYALNRASTELLMELKVWDALPDDAVTAVHDMHIEGDAHRSTLRFSSWAQGVDALAWIVDAGALQHALDHAVRFAPHVQRSETPVDAPLMALCEGKASAARDRLGVRFTPQHYGQRAIAARLVSDRPHAGVARQWFRSPDVLALDAAAFEAALAQATGGAAGSLALGSDRAAWPLMLAQADPVCGPGWVLLGDCAHVVHPLAGQGLNLGLADVAALARVLRGRRASA